MKRFKSIVEDIRKSGKEICIGAKDGTSFMYIGPYNEENEEFVKGLFEKNYKQQEEAFPRAYAKMETLAKCSYTFEDIYEGEKLIYSAEIQLINHCTEVGKAANRYRKIKAYLKSYQELDDRYVVEDYIRETDGRRVIMVTGGENGKYWFRDEVEIDLINEQLSNGFSVPEVAEILGYSSPNEVTDLIKHFEEEKEKRKAV